MKLTDELITHLKELSKVEFENEENDSMKNDLQKIISYFSEINEIDTDNIEPTSHSLENKNVFFDDEITNENNRDEILSNAKNRFNGYFKVQKTVD